MKTPPGSGPKVTEMLLRLFRHWQLTLPQQLAILGIPSATNANLNEHLQDHFFATDLDKIERVNILLGIHQSLRLLFPQNRDLAYRWISQPNDAFDGISPMNFIERNGILGLHIVRNYLDQHGATEGLTTEILIEGSPEISLDRSDWEWLNETPVGKEVLQQGLIFECKEISAMLEVWTAVLRAFGNEDKAKDWIGAIVPALGCMPIALFSTEHGREKVLAALKRIERADFG